MPSPPVSVAEEARAERVARRVERFGPLSSATCRPGHARHQWSCTLVLRSGRRQQCGMDLVTPTSAYLVCGRSIAKTGKPHRF